MGEVAKRALLRGIDERTAEGKTWIETEIIRQMLIAVNKMKENGDCIAEEKRFYNKCWGDRQIEPKK